MLYFGFILLLAGCGRRGQYVVAEVTFTRTQPIEDTLEVTKVKKFSKLKPTVAYIPPDSCINQSSGKNISNYISSNQVLLTNCGPWLAELERAFVTNGYNVISWSTLLSNRRQDATVVEKAKQNNVDVLLQINSLEIGIASSGDDSTGDAFAGSEWSFYEFTDDLTVDKLKNPLPLTKSEQESIISKAPKQAARPLKQMYATFDVTAIDLSSNQPIWFFRKTVSKQLEKGDDDGRWRGVFWTDGSWSNYYPEYTNGDYIGTPDMSTSVRLTNPNKEKANLYRKEKHQMIREIVKSLVTEFGKN